MASRSGRKGWAGLSYEEFRIKRAELFVEVRGEPSLESAGIAPEAFTTFAGFVRLMNSIANPKLDPDAATALAVLQNWSVVRLLKAAIEDRAIQPFEEFLQYLLYRLQIFPPAGFRVIPQKGVAGRPSEEIPRALYDYWVHSNRPKLNPKVLNGLVATFYPSEWAAAKASRDQTKLRTLKERARAAIQRFEKK
jgi:hypothetical protein